MKNTPKPGELFGAIHYPKLGKLCSPGWYQIHPSVDLATTPGNTIWELPGLSGLRIGKIDGPLVLLRREDYSEKFESGDAHYTCLIALSPEHGRVIAVWNNFGNQAQLDPPAETTTE